MSINEWVEAEFHTEEQATGFLVYVDGLPATSWRVRCAGCGVRSEWQASELAAQSWSASHRCAS